MTIHYTNGPAIEAVLLCETHSSIRVAARGAYDVVELTRVNDNFWVTPECEPVRLSFGAPPLAVPLDFVEDEFICPADLALSLVAMVRGETARIQAVAPPVAVPEAVCPNAVH